MREIKFRSWCPDDGGKGKMKTVGQIQFWHDGGIKWTDPDCDERYIMQYTGLKDSKGREIYEGDIVFGVDNEKDITRAEVKFRFGGFEPFTHYIESRRMDEVNCEVIGNIYENPELLG